MAFLDIMHSYFRGEKLEAALFIAPMGLAFLALAIGAWRSEQGPFMWGAVIPAVLFGALLLITGVSVAGRTSAQVATIEQGYQEAPAALVQAELPRMRGVMVLFSRTMPAFGLMALAGLGIRYGLRAEWATSLGAVLVAAGGIGLLIDGFAERRAHPYIGALEALAREQGVEPAPR